MSINPYPDVWIDASPVEAPIAHYVAVCSEEGCVAYFASLQDAQLFANILRGDVVPTSTEIGG